MLAVDLPSFSSAFVVVESLSSVTLCTHKVNCILWNRRVIFTSFFTTSIIIFSSAAALDIRVGSFHDPGHLQGLSHLCEHVLFTGSELFPSESYSSFLAQRGGSSNAYTTSEHTNFHFEVPSQHFVEALKRFVSFFRWKKLKSSSFALSDIHVQK